MTENKRGRGRPASFPDRKCVALLSRIPTDARDMLREVATKREEPLNVTLTRFIEQGHKAAMRSRSKAKVETETETANADA